MRTAVEVPSTTSKSLADSPEEAMNRCTNLAFRQVEDQLRKKTASPLVLVHFLKLATERERLEREKLESEIVLKKAQTKSIENAEHMEKLLADAMRAFSGYEWKGNDIDGEN